MSVTLVVLVGSGVVLVGWIWASYNRFALQREMVENSWSTVDTELRRRYDLRQVLIVDDTPAKVRRTYGNAIYVAPYLGQQEDDELLHLARYLESLAGAPYVRRLEKRGWRQQVLRQG